MKAADSVGAPLIPIARSGARGHTGHRIGEWHGRAKWPDATVARARELYAEVSSYESVGYLLGVPARTVADWIRRDTRWGGQISISRCLGPAVQALAGKPRGEWRDYLDGLPERCPHGDCTAQPGCRAYVAAYFRVQWRIAARLERRA